MFWFHPLAWWLERKLAVTAEHACDEAAARAIAAPGRYAEILVEMADVVRRNRGRLAWQAVGVNGAGLLDSRIDRLLRGDAFASASRGKKIAAGLAASSPLRRSSHAVSRFPPRRSARIRNWRRGSRTRTANETFRSRPRHDAGAGRRVGAAHRGEP